MPDRVQPGMGLVSRTGSQGQPEQQQGQPARQQEPRPVRSTRRRDSPTAQVQPAVADDAADAAGATADDAGSSAARLAACALQAPVALLRAALPDGRRVVGAWGLDAERQRQVADLADELLLASLAPDGTHLVTDLQDDAARGDLPAAPPFRGVAAVPLQPGRGPVLGALLVLDTRPRAWTESERVTLQDLAALVTARYEATWLRGRLVQAEVQRQQAIEHLPQALYLVDERWTLLAVNDAAETLFGRRREDLLGRSYWRCVPEPGSPQLRAALEEAMHARRSIGLEHHHAALGRWLRTRAVPVPGGLAICDEDVTGRREMENALRQSESLYRTLFHDNPRPMYVFDAETRRILEVNAAATVAYGYDAEEFRAMRVEDIRPAADVDAFLQALEQAAPVRHVDEVRHLRKDGATMVVDVTSHAVDFRGRPARLVVVDDITDRKRREDHLHLLEQVVAHMSDLVMVTEAAPLAGPGPRIVLVNPAFERITGHTPEATVGRTPRFLLGGDENREAVGRLCAGLRARETVREEVVVTSVGDGKVRDLELDVVPIDNPRTGTQWLVAHGHDITHRRRLEARVLHAHKMAAIGQLAGGVAHDFNNLLTAIIGFTEMMQLELAADAPHQENLEQIHRAADRAALLTQKLLAFGGRQVMQPRVLDLNTLLAGTSAMLRQLLGDGISLQLDLGRTVDAVRMDPVHIEQILVNLCVNGREAMPHGGRLLVATANRVVTALEAEARDVPAGRYVVLAVSDTGVGMDEDTRQRMFEPFFSTKKRGPGAGLGLASVYGTVEQCGGHIVVDSAPGRGTRIELHLPRADLEATGVGRPPDRVRGGDETILLAEDEDALRQLAGTALRRLGYRVLEAADGAEALAARGKWPGGIDLVVTDVVMPHMGGRELARRMSELDPLVPVLFVSGYSADLVGGLDDLPSGGFLQKPYSTDCLAAKVRELLDTHRR